MDVSMHADRSNNRYGSKLEARVRTYGDAPTLMLEQYKRGVDPETETAVGEFSLFTCRDGLTLIRDTIDAYLNQES